MSATLEYKLCLPALREIAKVVGPLKQANDDSEVNLAAAQVNYELLARGREWCHCGRMYRDGDTYEPDQVYWRNAATGSHGWMCCECRRITQVG
jgi:hypothetical protein